ncbi:MAG: PIN domain-containing protein [Lachnospiraceae bacterium]|nr:PIN domain-containing protein [Lachnospiraceae bacterium]
MSVYLIDYENVHYAGWEGIEKLTKEDEVILFYSENASTIPMELHIKVVNSGANLRYIHVAKTAKNYLDFQLSALSGYLVAQTDQTEFVVVSKDTGYNAVVDFWNQQDFAGRKVHFVRREQIAEISEVKKPAPKKKAAKKTKAKANSNTKANTKTGTNANVDVKDKSDAKMDSKTAGNTNLKANPKTAENMDSKTDEKAAQKDSRKAGNEAGQKVGPSGNQPASADSSQSKEKEKQEIISRAVKAKLEERKKKDQAPAKPEEHTKKEFQPLSLTNQQKTEIRSAVKPFKLPPSSYTKIYKIFRNARDKSDYNSALVKSFKDQEKGNQIYKATRKIFEKARV